MQIEGRASALEQAGHTRAGAAYTALVLEVFRLNGALLGAGNELCEGTSLTSARWQVLGAIVLSDQPPTVARIARVMGQTRQAVQRIVEELENEGLVRREADPFHKRALPVQITPRGRQLYSTVTRRQVPWANDIGAAFGTRKLQDAIEVLRQIAGRLDDNRAGHRNRATARKG